MIDSPTDASEFDAIVHVIQLSLTPIFLLTAVASLLGVFTTRLARVSDQVKALTDKVEPGCAAEATTLRRLSHLKRRTHSLDIAVVLGALSGGTTCATVLTLFLGILQSKAAHSLLFGMFGIAILCMMGALGAFLVEVLLASRGIREAVADNINRVEL